MYNLINTHTHTQDDRAGLRGYVQINKYTHTHIHAHAHFLVTVCFGKIVEEDLLRNRWVQQP